MISTQLTQWGRRIGLGVPPSQGLKEGLQWLMLSRLGLYYAILCIVVLQRVFRNDAIPPSALMVGYGLLVLGFAFNFLNSLFLEELTSGWWFAALNVIFDAAITSLWILGVGGPASLFALLYLVQILASALTLYQKGALLSATVSALCFGLVLYVTPHQQENTLVLWAIYSAIFVTLGVVGGFLSEELLRTTNSLKEKSQEIAKLTVLHDRIISNMPTGLLTVDGDMRINFLNPAGAHILNRSADEMVGKLLTEVEPDLLPFFQSIDSETVEEEADPVDQAMASDADKLSATGKEFHRSFFVQSHSQKGEARLQQRVEIGRGQSRRILRGDVAEIELAGALGRLLDTGVTGGRVLLFQDVTKLLHLEEKVRQSEKLAAVGQLAAGIAHEIRNPLASMSASIEMLKESIPAGEEHSENRRLMDIAIREIDRLNRLISEFLDFVKPERLKLGVVDLGKLLSEICLTLRESKDFKGKANLVENMSSGVFAMASSEKLRQVALNLLMNAAQAIAKSGRVEVGCVAVNEQSVKFWVEDEGQGMTEEVRQHLYEPFFTTKDKGTGLGLATAYKIIEAHQGEIRVSSTEKVGTRFEVILPSG